MKREANCLNRYQFNRGLLSIAPWVLLAWGSPGLAWTTEDCKNAEYSGQSDCVSESLLVQQQTLPGDKQPSESQRLVLVKELLSKQKAVNSSQKASGSMHQYCEKLFKDFRIGEKFKPIEPIAILDSQWIHDGTTPETRVPSEWNQCILPDYTKRRPTTPFNPLVLSNAIPPYRLYQFESKKYPIAEWRHIIELKMRGHERMFRAVSLDRCETTGGLHVARQRDSLSGESSPPKQAHALTQYQDQLLAVSIIDRTSFSISKADPDPRQEKSCHWLF